MADRRLASFICDNLDVADSEKVEELQTTVDDLQNETEDLKATIDELQTEITDLASELFDCKVDIDGHMDKIDKLKKWEHIATHRKDKLKRERDEHEEIVQRKSHKLTNARSEIEHYEQMIEMGSFENVCPYCRHSVDHMNIGVCGHTSTNEKKIEREKKMSTASFQFRYPLNVSPYVADQSNPTPIIYPYARWGDFATNPYLYVYGRQLPFRSYFGEDLNLSARPVTRIIQPTVLEYAAIAPPEVGTNVTVSPVIVPVLDNRFATLVSDAQLQNPIVGANVSTSKSNWIFLLASILAFVVIFVYVTQ